MFLKELEIFGFKSFPDKTTLKFEPGITVIVGPNGCGKSNVFDCIKWALGEQSPKSLRGAKMEDVIFNGTENHQALNYTEVALTFSNEDKYLPIDYKEVSVMRRLYRSGESQYFLNKNPVRLKDVQELFMGTGIGESTYSFIEQGKIEIFLSYKPEDKRLIFDEASGIIKYKSRRKETLKNLQETEDNLLRLEDIISEVRRQTRYLERQVEKAQKYKQVQENLIFVEKQIAVFQIGQLEEKNTIISNELNALQYQEACKEKILQDEKSRWEDHNLKLRNLRKQLEAANTAVISLKAQMDNSAAHINMYQQRIKELQGRNINIEQIKVSLNERLSLQASRVEEEKKRFNVINENVIKADEEIRILSDEKAKLAKENEILRKEIDENKSKVFELESNKVRAQNALIEVQTNLSGFSKRKQRLFLDKMRIEGLVKEKKESLARAQEKIGDVESTLNALRDKESMLLSKGKELLSRKEEFKSKLIEKEKELVELNSYYEFLKDFRIKYEVFPMKKNITIIFDEDPSNINKLIVSLKGVNFQQEGSVYKTRLEAKIISLEENELEQKINFTREEINKLKANLETIEKELGIVTEETANEVRLLAEEEKKWQEKLQEKESIQRDCARFDEELQLIEEEMRSTLESVEKLEQQQSEKEKEAAFYEENIGVVQQVMYSAQITMESNFKKTTQIDIDVVRRQEYKQSFHKEQENLHSKLALLEEEQANIMNNLKEIEREKEENSQRMQSLEGEITIFNLKIGNDKAEVEKYLQGKGELEKTEIYLNEEIDRSRKSIQTLEGECEQVKGVIYDKRSQVQNLEYEKEKIRSYLKQVYQIEFDVLSLEKSVQSIDELLAEKEKLIKRKSSLGEVNLIAIEEFEELKKREEFLEKQKQDLIVSKDNLKKAIQKINRTCRELFLEAFTRIQEEFKNNFKFLFNGGKANLILLDEENVLESGVDIEVQPPGKKLQNVSLLSGGEKALTAISLIFAIFRVRPSPLCVLDEIDAPLDEANVDRFNHLLKEFASFSQFIVITHNKRTMSNSDILYGVTMQEKGVSNLVSVKFASQRQEAAA